MSLQAKVGITLLGIGVGSFTPVITVYAALQPNTVTHYPNQANVQEATAQPKPAQPTEETPSQSNTQVNAHPKVKATKYKDQACAQPFSWDGLFLGVYAGGGWGNSYLNTNAGQVTGSSYFTSIANINSVSQSGTGTVHPNSAVWGVQIVDNVQSGRLVYGAAFDYGAFRLSRSKSVANVTYPTIPSQYTLTAKMTTTWLATLRGRLGWVLYSWPLVYATGGVGMTNLHVLNNFSDNSASMGVGGAGNTKIKFGWVAGAGIELPFRSNWTIDGEYQFVHFGSNTANGFVNCRGSGCSGRSPISTTANLSANIVKFGLNYKIP